MGTTPNKLVSLEGLAAALSESGGGGGGARGANPDWSQNDSTAADYIKNRPFYEGDPEEIPVEYTFINNQTDIRATADDELGTYYIYIQGFLNGVAPTAGDVINIRINNDLVISDELRSYKYYGQYDCAIMGGAEIFDDGYTPEDGDYSILFFGGSLAGGTDNMTYIIASIFDSGLLKYDPVALDNISISANKISRNVTIIDGKYLPEIDWLKPENESGGIKNRMDTVNSTVWRMIEDVLLKEQNSILYYDGTVDIGGNFFAMPLPGCSVTLTIGGRTFNGVVPKMQKTYDGSIIYFSINLTDYLTFIFSQNRETCAYEVYVELNKTLYPQDEPALEEPCIVSVTVSGNILTSDHALTSLLQWNDHEYTSGVLSRIKDRPCYTVCGGQDVVLSHQYKMFSNGDKIGLSLPLYVPTDSQNTNISMNINIDGVDYAVTGSVYDLIINNRTSKYFIVGSRGVFNTYSSSVPDVDTTNDPNIPLCLFVVIGSEDYGYPSDFYSLTLVLDDSFDTSVKHYIEIRATVPDKVIKLDDKYQHQADWNESDTTKAAYIKNKPTLLPSVTSSDSGKALMVNGSGIWTAQNIPEGLPTIENVDYGKSLSIVRDSNNNLYWDKKLINIDNVIVPKPDRYINTNTRVTFQDSGFSEQDDYGDTNATKVYFMSLGSSRAINSKIVMDSDGNISSNTVEAGDIFYVSYGGKLYKLPIRSCKYKRYSTDLDADKKIGAYILGDLISDIQYEDFAQYPTVKKIIMNSNPTVPFSIVTGFESDNFFPYSYCVQQYSNDGAQTVIVGQSITESAFLLPDKYQHQSVWDETDTTSASFIWNKPDVYTKDEVDSRIQAAIASLQDAESVGY